MLQRFKNDEGGFTLIELLVVILIIGILAAIALPTFLGQQKKGQDSSAKSDARNAVTQVEACYTEKQSYADCDTITDMPELNGKLVTAAAPEKITMTNTETTWSIEAVSKAKTGTANHTFTIAKDANGAITRSCTPTGQGGCPSSGSW